MVVEFIEEETAGSKIVVVENIGMMVADDTGTVTVIEIGKRKLKK